MKIIDFHTHIFPPEQIAARDQLAKQDTWFAHLYGTKNAPMATVETLLRVAEKNGVTRSVVFSFPWQDSGLLREANAYVFESTSRHPDRLSPFLTLHVGDEKTTVEELERARPVEPAGIGELMPDGNGYRLKDVELLRTAAEFAVQRKLPLLTHTSEPFGHDYPGKGRTYAQEVLALAEAYPELVIVCGHWGGGLIFWELQPELKTPLKNVYYDTAATCYLYSNRIYEVAETIAPGKVLFGSDYPACPVARQIRGVQESDASAKMKKAVLGENARKLLGLKED